MMARWHHSDSSMAMSTEHDSVKKKTVELNSRSNLFSAGIILLTLSAYIEADHGLRSQRIISNA